jgi:6-phosphogluconate dehydrogenase
MAQADIGMIGLGVMGQNLALNMDGHGFVAAAYDRFPDVVDGFLAGPARGTRVIGARSPEELVAALRRPRRVMLMIRAGAPVDDMIARLQPILEPGDILIDGGNSNYADTNRRVQEAEARGLLFLGVGISGGEEGARHGPSIMPGGSRAAWDSVRPIFRAIAAKVPRPGGGEDVCCDWVGESGAGHYVKMVHNGIEYGDMQLVSEAYHLMAEGLGLDADGMRDVFARWNEGKLNSYLIEITRDILGTRDSDGRPLLDKIVDVAGQKGTGRWAGISGLENGIPLTLITEAVLARYLSTLKAERVAAARRLSGPDPRIPAATEAFAADLGEALYAAKIISYTQGYMLMQEAAAEFGWNLNCGGIALMWRGGCIIRSVFLDKIKEAYDRDPRLVNLLMDPYFQSQVESAQPAWRRVTAAAIVHGIPVPALASALAFYDSYRRERLPANLIQAQRDYFGAHTYERVDRPSGEFFHTNWTGRGGETTSSSYTA